MRKLFLLPILMLGLAMSAQTTGFKAGVHVGFPVGDASNISSFNIGADVAYLWKDVAPKLSVGVASGYDHFIAKNVTVGGGTINIGGQIIDLPRATIKVKDFGFVPIAAVGQYDFNPKVFGSIDIGYAIATNSDFNGGFYFVPKVGMNIDAFQAFVFYKLISNNGSISTLGIGGAYNF